MQRPVRIKKIISLKSKKNGLFLEGLGSLIHDHINRIVYMSKSKRSNPRVLKNYLDILPKSYKSFLFETRKVK